MRRIRVDTYTKEIVYNTLGVGKENAMSRSQLVEATGFNDRYVRKAIELLRYDYPILTLRNGNGYYIPVNNAQGRQETYKWIQMQNHRAGSIKTALNGAKKFLNIKKYKQKEIPGQISMFGAGNVNGLYKIEP